MHVGNEYIGDSLPNIPSWYSDFSIYQPGSITPVNGDLGNDPAGHFKPDRQGTYVIGYQSTFTYVEIDSDTFNKYLNEEGLQNAIDYRRKHRQSETQGNEDYIRHPKVLVQAGEGFSIDNSGLNIGYELEIIPLENPYRKNINDPLDFQVLYRNKPEQDIMLIAFSKHRPELIQRVRTDQQGKARVTLDQAGPWLVKAVKIIRLKNEKADWQSHWASLTFEMLATNK